MKRLNLKLVALFPFFLILLVFLTLPKFLLLDRFLLQKGLYLTATSVKETPLSLRLTEVSIYGKGSKLVHFDKLNVSLGLSGVELYGVCKEGSLSGRWSLQGLKLRAKNFTCLYGLDLVDADLTFREGIYGRVYLRGVKLEGSELEELSIELKGRTFSAKAKYMGFELVGDGQIVYNQRNPLASKINGQVSGGGIRLTVSGTLEKPQLLR